MQLVSAVATKTFIAAVTRQRDSHMPARQLANPVGRNRRAVCKGLVVKMCQQVHQPEIIAADDLYTVRCAVAVGHELGELSLVEGWIVKAYGTCIHRLVIKLRHGGHYRARIHTTGKKSTQRNLGLQPQLDRLAKTAAQLLGGLLLADLCIQREFQVPVALRRTQRLTALEEQAMPWCELECMLVDSGRIGHITKSEICFDRARIDLLAQAAMSHQALEFRAKQ